MTNQQGNTANTGIQDFLATMDTVCQKVEAHPDHLDSNEVDKLRQSLQTLKTAINEEDSKNRLLRVGIIGSVKAGKSTFLNALLFNGETILPKAATPMTASLTRLRHTDGQQSVRFVFYSKKDWDEIDETASRAKAEIKREIEDAHKRYLDDKRPSARRLDDFDEAGAREALWNGLSEERRACCELCKAAERIGDLARYQGQEKKSIFQP
jgi:ATPase subunit of ABC transporter with duplicated ATPase domains